VFSNLFIQIQLELTIMSLKPSFADAVRIRIENTENFYECASVRTVNEAAFGGSEEADLVDELRARGDALISLVAEIDGSIVGHIMFSRMWIRANSRDVPAVALAPMAVLPSHQRKGIGQLLVRHGLNGLRGIGETIVIVVGHAEYYPRFGFSSEAASSLQGPFPREVFMAMELRAGALAGVEGSVVYPAPFGI
jgi:putative acetyltransferase